MKAPPREHPSRRAHVGACRASCAAGVCSWSVKAVAGAGDSDNDENRGKRTQTAWAVPSVKREADGGVPPRYTIQLVIRRVCGPRAPRVAVAVWVWALRLPRLPPPRKRPLTL